MALELRGFDRPSLAEIRDRVQADIETNLPGQGAKLRFSPLSALAEAGTGLAHELYGFLTWISRQTNVIECEDENLDLWGAVWGVDRKQPSYSTGTATFTGTNGKVIPIDTLIKNDDGLFFKTTAAGTITTGSAVIAIRSVLAGSNNNLPTGTILTLTSPIVGVNSTSTVPADITGGADLESDDDYRSRILSRIRQNGHGGNANDYVNWALEVPGVTRAWVTSQEYGALSVTVRFMMDNTYLDGLPLSGDITTVNTYIQDRKPIVSYVVVEAPAVKTVNLTITGLSPVSQLIKDNITAEITELLRVKSEPGKTIYLSWLYNAISLASGVDHFRITNPTTDVNPEFNEICKLGTITYT